MVFLKDANTVTVFVSSFNVESQEGGIFSNKKFALVGLRADEEQELVQFIEEADGKLFV